MAQEFAKALKLNMARKDGYLESDEAIVTWCVGHLVTMSYPEVYDEQIQTLVPGDLAVSSHRMEIRGHPAV